MKKKLFAALLAATMVVSLAACGAKEEAPAEEPAAQEEEKAEEAETPAAETRTVIVGTVGSGEPYSLVADDGSWTGVCADVWAEIAERTGWDVQMEQTGDLASVFGSLDTGKIDVADNCFAITEARLEKYICSDPLYADAQVIIVPDGSEIETFEDLRGCSMGVTAGQAAQNTVEGMAPEYDWEVVTYEDSAAGFLDCYNGRLDAYANTITNIVKAENTQNIKFKQLEEKLFGNNVGMWFADTAEGAELRDAINEVIAEMHADGTMKAICEKWFMEDMTVQISDQWLSAADKK